MWYEIFKFELKYRAKRADTYIYFALLFCYALIAVDFIFNENLNPIKRNAPYIIAKVMGIIAALFTMLTSMIMGVAVLRDFDHNVAPLLFVNPIKKSDYLLGRFLGSTIVLPNLFFTGAIFFVAGALSRKLLVVYTQGIILLMCYIFTLQMAQGSDDPFLPALIDPFAYQTINVA